MTSGSTSFSSLDGIGSNIHVVGLARCFSIPVLETPCSADFACLPYLTHLIELISLLGERDMN